MTKHGRLTAHWNIRTNSHLVEWSSNGKVVGRLDPGKAGGWDVFYGEDAQPHGYSLMEGELLGAADTLERGMEMLEAKANKET